MVTFLHLFRSNGSYRPPGPAPGVEKQSALRRRGTQGRHRRNRAVTQDRRRRSAPVTVTAKPWAPLASPRPLSPRSRRPDSRSRRAWRWRRCASRSKRCCRWRCWSSADGDIGAGRVAGGRLRSTFPRMCCLRCSQLLAAALISSGAPLSHPGRRQHSLFDRELCRSGMYSRTRLIRFTHDKRPARSSMRIASATVERAQPARSAIAS